MKLIFFGSPEYSLPSLTKLYQSHHEIIAIYTQPDKPSGRGSQENPTPIKSLANELNIPVYTPSSLKTDEAFNQLNQLEFDLGVVIAYGNILSTKILNIPKYGYINAHGSLLPQYRGASPITAPLLNGDSTTGVTIQKMVLKVDAGDIVNSDTISISKEDNASTLHDKLSELSSTLLLETCNMVETNKINAIPQDESKATFVKKLTKQMGHINWNESANIIERKIRAFYPWPGSFSFVNLKNKDARIKILKATSTDEKGQPGIIKDLNPLNFLIGTGNGCLRIFKLQREGKKKQSTAEFLNGNQLDINNQWH
ncbi:MAG: methionyl-tRNA formyltransferase [Planctomycetota bacterium]|nr:MAG: methionyl-tRNA formyltransferase [Planctomycetota bacterium]